MASDEAKRLRSSEPDLKVVLGGGDGAENVQWHHANNLASKSNYIDALLAAPMREREERTISFPDISPDVWRKMLTFLDDPIAIRNMTPKDALEVVPFYDKYEFVEGRRLCNQVVADYLRPSNIGALEKKFAVDFDLVVDLVAVAHSANMEDSFKLGVPYIWNMMFVGGDATYGRISFSVEHLTKLAPALKYSLDNNERLGLGLSDRVTNFAANGAAGVPAVDDQTFPEKFVAKSKRWEEEHFVDRCVSHIELAGTACKANGKYWAEYGICPWSKRYEPHCEDPQQWERDTWDGTPVTFAIQYIKEDDFEGWAILRLFDPTIFDEEDGDPQYEGFSKTKCWIAPCSANRSRPPLIGWVSADPKARGNPTIKYFLRRFVGS
ncbi:hypothetical protein ACHAXT_009038 [Thalassiosira profunda]